MELGRVYHKSAGPLRIPDSRHCQRLLAFPRRRGGFVTRPGRKGKLGRRTDAAITEPSWPRNVGGLETRPYQPPEYSVIKPTRVENT